jgi:hypothetical protein
MLGTQIGGDFMSPFMSPVDPSAEGRRHAADPGPHRAASNGAGIEADVARIMEPVMRRNRLRRQLLIVGLVLFAGFIAGAGGAYPRYNRIVYGALPLALALICFGGVAYLYGSDVHRRAWIGSGIGCWLIAAGVLAIWIRPSFVADPRREPRTEREQVLLTLPRDRFRAALFAEIQPVELSNCRLERFGERYDGGYLVCGNLLGSIKAGYSYGISGYDQWGCDVARKFNVRVHEYDCFNLTKPSCADGVTVFHAECVGPSRRTGENGRIFDTLENQLASNGDGADRVVLKMDVEGAEWETLLLTTSAVLERIDQLVVEFHGVGLEHQIAVVRRLKQFFHVAHLHFNNNACAERIDPFPAWAYEVLFVNKRITTARGPAAAGTNPLDAPNSPLWADCQIPPSRWSHAIPGALRFGHFQYIVHDWLRRVRRRTIAHN